MKIAVILTGGTIGSSMSEKGIAPAAGSTYTVIEEYRRRWGDEVEFITFEPYRILSENLTFSHLKCLGETAREAAKHSDGIIITHGTDSLPYTATALSYLLGLSFPPTVLVSANYILSDEKSNGHDNFAAAVAFLKEVPCARGVYVSYRNSGEPVKIHRGGRLLAHTAPLDRVTSLGEVGVFQKGHITLSPDFTEQEDGMPPLSVGDAPARVLFLRAHPAMLLPSHLEEIDAILAETFHAGTMPTGTADFAAACRRIHEANIPFFLAGMTGEDVYASVDLFRSLHLKMLPRMSPVAAYMKLSLLLRAGLPLSLMETPLGGDFA